MQGMVRGTRCSRPISQMSGVDEDCETRGTYVYATLPVNPEKLLQPIARQARRQVRPMGQSPARRLDIKSHRGRRTPSWDSNAANSTEALGLLAPVHSSIFQNRVTIDNISMVLGPQMTIKPVPVSEMDLTRARQIVRSLEALKALTNDDAEIVARTIAQSFAAGRRQGLEIAKYWSDDDWRRAATAGVVSRTATARATSQGESHAQDKAVRPRRS